MTVFPKGPALAIIFVVCLGSLEVTATGSSCLDTKPADWCNTKCDNQNKCSRKANCQSRCKQTCGLCDDAIEAPTQVITSPKAGLELHYFSYQYISASIPQVNAPQKCSTSDPYACWGNGECVDNTYCQCAPGWKGETCNILDLMPIRRSSPGLILSQDWPNDASSSWTERLVRYVRSKINALSMIHIPTFD